MTDLNEKARKTARTFTLGLLANVSFAAILDNAPPDPGRRASGVQHDRR